MSDLPQKLMPRRDAAKCPGRKPSPASSRTCEQCGKKFHSAPANRTGGHVFCSSVCAALFRERAAGHHGKVTLPCGFCGQPVTRYASKARSQTTKAEPAAFYCSREHFLASRRGAECDKITRLE